MKDMIMKIIKIGIIISIIILGILGVSYLTAGVFDYNFKDVIKDVDMDRYIQSKYIRYDMKFYFVISDLENYNTEIVEVTEGAYNSYEVGDWYDTIQIRVVELIDSEERIKEITSTWILVVSGIFIVLIVIWIIMVRIVKV